MQNEQNKQNEQKKQNETGYEVKGASLLNLNDVSKLGYRAMLSNMNDSFLYGLNYTLSGAGFKGKDLALGKNYFIKSGLCDGEFSDVDCSGQQKYTYVRNIPIGKIPPLGVSFKDATGCNLAGVTEMRGVVPGLIEDIYDINPVEIATGLTRNGNLGSTHCKKMKLPVGYEIYNTKQRDKTWKFEERCTAGHTNMISTTNTNFNNSIKNENPHITDADNIKNAAIPGAMQLGGKEKFSGKENFLKNSQNSIHIILLFLLLLLLLLFFI